MPTKSQMIHDLNEGEFIILGECTLFHHLRSRHLLNINIYSSFHSLIVP